MGVEIERKFLVANDNWRVCGESQPYRQGYISSSKECVVRLRTVGDKGYLTVKGGSKGISRLEYEYEIPVQECLEMMEKLAAGTIIEKKRCRVEYKGSTWEIDEFEGANKGLIIAEIELEHPDQSFEKPEWLGTEVSGDPRYFNSNLAVRPYSKW